MGQAGALDSAVTWGRSSEPEVLAQDSRSTRGPAGLIPARVNGGATTSKTAFGAEVHDFFLDVLRRSDPCFHDNPIAEAQEISEP